MKISILGAGFIGVTTAYFLAKEGHQVSLIERHNGPAEECSYSNGAQLSYCHAEPWAGIKTLKNAAKWIGKNDAPLLFRFRFDTEQWLWMLKFLTYCNAKSAAKNTEKILSLGLYSRKILHESNYNFDFNYEKGGKLFIFEDKEEYNIYLHQARFQELLGSRYQVLSEKEALGYEPSLESFAPKVHGYIRDPLDESADPYKFTLGLNEELKKMPNVALFYDEEIKEISTEGKNISKVITDKQEIEADLFICCLGAYSKQFGKQIGINIPIHPIKGYSITADIKNSAKAPLNSITNYYEKIVFSRLGNKLRVAGTAEFAGYDHSISRERIDMMKHSLEKHFPGSYEEGNVSEWACLRPVTPDSVPIISRSKYDNLLFNTGHGTLGWTQNFSSAQLISDMVMGRKTELDLSWYDLNRF